MPPSEAGGLPAPMLSVEHVSKTYLPPPRALRLFLRAAIREPLVALRDVSFSVARGEIVGLVGSNGAGKTTLLKIIATLLEPTEGRVLLDGQDVAADPKGARHAIGLVLSDDRGLYWRLTARQNLEFFAGLGGMGRASARARVTELLEWVGLPDSDKLVFGYSTGMRSLLNLARSLLWNPSLLLLDEPTRSVDPEGSAAVGRMLADVAATGCSILVCSHRMDEVASWCRRVVVLQRGEVGGSLPIGEHDGDTDSRAAVWAPLLAEDTAP